MHLGQGRQIIAKPLIQVTGTNSQTVYLDASNNVSNVQTATNIQPASDGTVTIVVAKGPNNNNAKGFFYLGVLRISLDKQAPTKPVDLSASSINGPDFTLSWTASTDNVGVSSYEIYKGGTLFATTAGTSILVDGLTQNTSYSMTVKAVDAAGNVSDESSALVVKTKDTELPTAPADVAASSITGTGFSLSWTASTDNVGVTGYNVYLDNVLKTSVATAAATITGLTQNTTYSVTVKAIDAVGNESLASTALGVKTKDTEAPSAPTNVVASSITGTDFTLTWTASTDNEGVTGYDVYLNNNLKTSVAGPSAIITGLVQYTTYSVTVKAKDAAANVSTASTAVDVKTKDTEIPSAPTNVVASSITGTGFTLSWTASSDNAGVTGYDVYLDNNFKATVTSSPASITGLTQNTTYSVTVKAKDAASNASSASTVINVKTLDAQAPTAPTNVVSSIITGTGFSLSWTASADNVGVTGYDVYLNNVLKTSVTTTTATITGLTQNTTYSVTVKAKDAATNASSASTAVDVKTLDTEAPSAPTNVAAASITGTGFSLSWTASTDNAAVTGYDVYLDNNLKISVATTTATITGLVQNTTYSVTVKAKDAASNASSASTAINVKTLDAQAPTAPTNVVASSITGTGFSLSWTASADNVGVTGYDVYLNNVLKTSATTTTATIAGLTQNTTYSVTVKAKDAATNASSASTAVDVKNSGYRSSNSSNQCGCQQYYRYWFLACVGSIYR